MQIIDVIVMGKGNTREKEMIYAFCSNAQAINFWHCTKKLTHGKKPH